MNSDNIPIPPLASDPSYDPAIYDLMPPPSEDERELDFLKDPTFTGHCPDCRYVYPTDPEPLRYDCPECGWVDDLI